MASPLVQLTGSDPSAYRHRLAAGATAPAAAPLLSSRAYRQASQNYQTHETPARLAFRRESGTVIRPTPATVHRDAN